MYWETNGTQIPPPPLNDRQGKQAGNRKITNDLNNWWQTNVGWQKGWQANGHNMLKWDPTSATWRTYLKKESKSFKLWERIEQTGRQNDRKQWRMVSTWWETNNGKQSKEDLWRAGLTPSPKLSETWWEWETNEGTLPESQIPQPTRGQTKN